MSKVNGQLKVNDLSRTESRSKVDGMSKMDDLLNVECLLKMDDLSTKSWGSWRELEVLSESGRSLDEMEVIWSARLISKRPLSLEAVHFDLELI